MPDTKALQAELDALNAAVDAARKARTAWMDAHMADFAKHPVGTKVWNLRTGKCLGVIAEHYRYDRDRDGGVYDTDMSIHYRFTDGDNTSRQMLSSWDIVDQRELAEALTKEAAALAAQL
jgi:hypothetical protein